MSSRLSDADYSKLNEDLNFIQERDEHADIAAGAQTIDESIVDEILESSEDSAAAAQRETQSSEVKDDSCHHQQLKEAL